MSTPQCKNLYIALALAVFFGPFTWLYTFSRDAVKAVVGIAINFTMLCIFIYVHLLNSNYHPIQPTPDNFGIVVWLMALVFFIFSWGITVILALDDVVHRRDWKTVEQRPPNKGTSIRLAIFLGSWTWLYTFERDRWKFIPAFILVYGGFFATFFVPHTGRFWLIDLLAFRLLAIFDVANQKPAWYQTISN